MKECDDAKECPEFEDGSSVWGHLGSVMCLHLSEATIAGKQVACCGNKKDT
jgi:hypothetical protein